MSAVKIKQVRSANGTNPKQKATLKALGLGRIGKVCRAQGLAAAAGSAAGRLAPGRGRADGCETPRSEEIGLHNLKPKPGSKRPRKRIGRGEGSGLGKTSGRGHKGAGSRAGAKQKAGYEGGQNPIHMRMRKLRGPHMKKSMPFENFRTKTQPVNLADLEERFEAGAEVTPRRSRRRAWPSARTRSRSSPAARSRRSSTVHAHAFSAAAKEKIEAAGGSCHTLEP